MKVKSSIVLFLLPGFFAAYASADSSQTSITIKTEVSIYDDACVDLITMLNETLPTAGVIPNLKCKREKRFGIAKRNANTIAGTILIPANSTLIELSEPIKHYFDDSDNVIDSSGLSTSVYFNHVVSKIPGLNIRARKQSRDSDSTDLFVIIRNQYSTPETPADAPATENSIAFNLEKPTLTLRGQRILSTEGGDFGSGNGGSGHLLEVASEFLTVAQEVHNDLETWADGLIPNLARRNLQEVIDGLRDGHLILVPVNGPVGGLDARNNKNGIAFNAVQFVEFRADYRKQKAFVLHELLGVLNLEVGHYSHSGTYLTKLVQKERDEVVESKKYRTSHHDTYFDSIKGHKPRERRTSGSYDGLDRYFDTIEEYVPQDARDILSRYR